jgi:signal transduction histidine kinase
MMYDRKECRQVVVERIPMKPCKSFSRFLLWILIVLESLSLAVVIGFLYAMLNRSISQEYYQQVEIEALGIQNLIDRQSNLARVRLDEISSNNGVKVSLLLGMFDKAEELMRQLYPPSDGASFYLVHSSGLSLPEFKQDNLLRNQLGDGFLTPDSFARIEIDPTRVVFSQALRHDQKVLGTVIAVYDIAEDPVVAEVVDAFEDVRLMVRIQNRYQEVGRTSTGSISQNHDLIGIDRAEAGFGQSLEGSMVPFPNRSGLYFAVNATQLAEKQWNLIVNIILICIPLFGLTLTVSFLILKKVTASINALVQNAREIAEAPIPEDLDEQVVQHEEFLHLARAFNKVLSKVRRSADELRRHQHHLDQLVDERTAELQESNLKLTREVEDRERAQRRLSKSKEVLTKTLAKLKQSQAQMVHSEKMVSIGQLAAGVAHEINNPIGFIKSNIHTLKEYCVDIKRLLGHYGELESAQSNGLPLQEMVVKVKDFKAQIDYEFVYDELDCVLDESQEGVERVARIVRALKDFSHADTSGVDYSDINRGIENTLSIVESQLKYVATVNKDFGEIPLVKCDPEQMNQVFMNLLLNAGQAIERDGAIDIRTRHSGQVVEINISDNGCGIAPDIAPKIFDPFFTTKEIGNGTGLGLNHVYNIVKGHNGSIEVKSEVDKGTTFTIRLDVDGGPVSPMVA